MSNYKRYYLNDYKYIFFTLVTNNRRSILIQNIELLKQSLIYTMSKYKFEIFSIVVLDNHLHFILKIDNPSVFSKIIYSFKYYFSIHLNKSKNLSQSKINKGEKGIWQRRFYEHIIRNEVDLYRHTDYIHYNPVKHNYVTAAKLYPYSSFNKFVKLGLYEENWCNFRDKYGINDLDLE